MEATPASNLLIIFSQSIKTRVMDTFQLREGTLKEINLEMVATKSSFRPLVTIIPMPVNTTTKVGTTKFYQWFHHFH
jgi:hypothetical protein